MQAGGGAAEAQGGVTMSSQSCAWEVRQTSILNLVLLFPVCVASGKISLSIISLSIYCQGCFRYEKHLLSGPKQVFREASPAHEEQLPNFPTSIPLAGKSSSKPASHTATPKPSTSKEKAQQLRRFWLPKQVAKEQPEVVLSPFAPEQ